MSKHRHKSMYVITANLRKSRTPGRPGYIVIRLRDKLGSERLFATGITSTEEELTTIHKTDVLKRIKVIYDVIERFGNTGNPYTIDDIAGAFRCKNPDEIEKADVTDFKVRLKLASIGRPFDKYVYAVEGAMDIHFEGNNLSTENLTDYISGLLASDEKLSRHGTVCNYKSTGNALANFIETLPPARTAIDGEFVADFQHWLAGIQKLTGSTVSFYLRVLRAVLNKAGSEGLISVSDNWFRGLIRQYPKDCSSDKEKALGKEEINSIANINLEADPLMNLSRDLFMFSFYCRGMELIDILNLKRENINGNLIIFNKRLTGLQKVMKIDPGALRIIDKYAVNGSGDIIFSAIHNYTRSTKYATFRHMIAPKIADLGRLLGIRTPLKFSTARSTWLYLAGESDLSSMMLK